MGEKAPSVLLTLHSTQFVEGRIPFLMLGLLVWKTSAYVLIDMNFSAAFYIPLSDLEVFLISKKLPLIVEIL